MPPPLRATRGASFYLVASAFTCRVCSAYSSNSLHFVMGGGQSTAHSSTICFYYTTINFFCQVFYTTFLELFRFFSSLPWLASQTFRFAYPLRHRFALPCGSVGSAAFNLALSKREFYHFPFAQLLHISEMLSSLFFSVAGLLGLGFALPFSVIFFVDFGKGFVFLAAA